MVETKKQYKRTVNSDQQTDHRLLITDHSRNDMWGMIDEIEEKYGDLIDDLESDDTHKPRHPGRHALPRGMRAGPKMKVTGASVREIPRIQEKRRRKK